MAVPPSYTTDLLTYNDCTANTGWGEAVGMALGAVVDQTGGLVPIDQSVLVNPSSIAAMMADMPSSVWGTEDAKKLLEEFLGHAEKSVDGTHVTIRNRLDNEISHEFDITDGRIRTAL
jgi:hypothetical protein